MPRRKKKPVELTTDEAIRKLFPRKVVKATDRYIGKEPKPQVTPPKPSISKEQ